MKNFVTRHYKVLFRTSLIEGLVFLMLFLTGLARYRVTLVFIINGLLSAINQYVVDKDSNPEITYYYGLLKRGFAVLVLIALFFDINGGQISPVYPNLPIWITIICVVMGYGFSLLLFIKAGYLLQWIGKGEIFIVCPNCSFENLKVAKKCGNCGYTKDIPLEKHAYNPLKEEIPDDLKNEISFFKDMGMYRVVPKEITRALKIENNEYILIAMKSPSIFYFSGVKKNDKRMMPGWFMLTNKKIVCYYGQIGWTGIDLIPYKDIMNVRTVLDYVAYKKQQWLEINAQSNTYRFLFGPTTKNLCKRVMFFEADNKLTLDSILRSINKRLPARPVAA